jgi:hypothetical protein
MTGRQIANLIHWLIIVAALAASVKVAIGIYQCHKKGGMATRAGCLKKDAYLY